MILQIEFIPRQIQKSDYDWADFSYKDQPVGKARCQIDQHRVVIFSINIYPEWKGHGFGRQFVDYCKEKFQVVVADRVRVEAIGFWQAMGFVDENNGNWVYCRHHENS
jgi:GNAT superfamily N-acetyltransferase